MQDTLNSLGCSGDTEVVVRVARAPDGDWVECFMGSEHAIRGGSSPVYFISIICMCLSTWWVVKGLIKMSGPHFGSLLMQTQWAPE